MSTSPAVRSDEPAIAALDPAFAAALADHDLAQLDELDAPIVGLHPDLRIGYLNPAWQRFARCNDGGDVVERWGLGAALVTAIAGELRDFYVDAYRAVLAGGQPWEHTYECSSPALRRVFRQRVLPLGGRGLLVSHVPVVEEPHDEPGHLAIEARYRAPSGLIVQCSYCRKTRVAGDPRCWEFVPAHVAVSPPDTSHGLCPTCEGHYFGSWLRGGR
jgi:hypothetical protein